MIAFLELLPAVGRLALIAITPPGATMPPVKLAKAVSMRLHCELAVMPSDANWDWEHCDRAVVFCARGLRCCTPQNWQVIEKVGICMLTTRFEGGLRARRLEARPDRTSNRLLFVTDVHSAKHYEVERRPEVGLVFIDPADKAYLSISGKAQIVDDPELRAAAWRETDVVWWPGGPHDAEVCVLVVDPTTAELWDGPSSTAVAAYEFAKARETGTEPDLEENRKVTVGMKC